VLPFCCSTEAGAGARWSGVTPVGGVVAPSLPVVAVLRHGDMDKWLKGGERKMEMLQRGDYARGKEGGEGRTLAASL
jgi:hypothetical protein